MAIYERDESFSHWVTIRDRNEQKVDPSSVKITIQAPNGNDIVTSQNMTKDSTGVYYYDHDLSSTASYGKYTVKVISTSGGSHKGIIEDEFFIMPWKLEKAIHRNMGTSSNDIDDEDLSHIAWDSYKEALHDVHSPHRNEKPSGNPDNGEGFDGSNTSFQTKAYPIADIGGDGSVGDSSNDEADISCYWIDENGHRNTGYVTITEANNGEISLYQSDGATAIPNTNEGVYLDYWSEYDTYDSFLFKKAVALLAAHYLNNRMTEADKTTIADINSNRPVVLKNPNRFLREYDRVLSKIRKSRIRGVK